MIIGKLEFLHHSQPDQETPIYGSKRNGSFPGKQTTSLPFPRRTWRARLILELNQDLGVNDEGVGVILSLLERVHSLRRALAGTLDALHEQSAAPDAGTSTRQGQDRE